MVSEQRILPQDTASICHMHRQIECFTCEIINFLGSYGGGSINYGPFSGGMLPCVENFRSSLFMLHHHYLARIDGPEMREVLTILCSIPLYEEIISNELPHRIQFNPECIEMYGVSIFPRYDVDGAIVIASSPQNFLNYLQMLAINRERRAIEQRD